MSKQFISKEMTLKNQLSNQQPIDFTCGAGRQNQYNSLCVSINARSSRIKSEEEK